MLSRNDNKLSSEFPTNTQIFRIHRQRSKAKGSPLPTIFMNCLYVRVKKESTREDMIHEGGAFEFIGCPFEISIRRNLEKVGISTNVEIFTPVS